MSLATDIHLCYVLHTRAYRETSMLIEIFSSVHGRVSLVARGAKRGKAKLSSLLQPFIPLNISWFGMGDLVTLTSVEPQNTWHSLSVKNVICGLYINELLIKLMHKWDPCFALFTCYEQTLGELAREDNSPQIALRKFELQLLRSLGYALQLKQDVTTQSAINADSYYMFDPIAGPKLISKNYVGAIKGASLLALAVENFEDKTVLADIKSLMRLVLQHHLGAKQLKSRELLQ